MKTKSIILLFTGIVLGVIGSYLFTPPKGRSKRRKELSKKSRKYNKAFKITASKYKEKLGEM